jgi:hypothetical protein
MLTRPTRCRQQQCDGANPSSPTQHSTRAPQAMGRVRFASEIRRRSTANSFAVEYRRLGSFNKKAAL